MDWDWWTNLPNSPSLTGLVEVINPPTRFGLSHLTRQPDKSGELARRFIKKKCSFRLIFFIFSIFWPTLKWNEVYFSPNFSQQVGTGWHVLSPLMIIWLDIYINFFYIFSAINSFCPPFHGDGDIETCVMLMGLTIVQIQSTTALDKCGWKVRVREEKGAVFWVKTSVYGRKCRVVLVGLCTVAFLCVGFNSDGCPMCPLPHSPMHGPFSLFLTIIQLSCFLPIVFSLPSSFMYMNEKREQIKWKDFYYTWENERSEL